MDNLKIINNNDINEKDLKETNDIGVFHPGVKKIPKVILPLDEILVMIDKKKTWTLKSANTILDYLYQYQKIAFEKNDKNSIEKIDFYIKYIKHQIDYLNSFQNHLLTLVATIFLPLSFITGFFGMNFKSMGAPSLKSGIFNINHGDKIIWIFSILLFIFLTILYFNLFKII